MKILIMLLVVLVAGTVHGQDYTFKVLINKGQNTVKAGSNWVPVKVGATLKAADELRIAPSGYLGLVHISGKPLEVKEAGQYNVQDLTSRVKEGVSVLSKYTDFILSSSAENTSNLTATGAVTRGTEEIRLYLPEPRAAIVLNDEVMISWSQEKKTALYVVALNSMFGDPLDRFEVSDTTLVLNLNGPKLANEDNIVVKVYSKADGNINSSDFIIKKLSAGDKNRLRKELDEIKSLMNEDTALNQYYLAKFYEQNTLLIDAASAYLKAIRMAPEVNDFRDAFDAFAKRRLGAEGSVAR